MPDFPPLNLVFWKKIIEQFMPLLGGSITTLDISGRIIMSNGLPPEQCTPGSHLRQECLKEALYAFTPYTIYACEHTSRHLAIPLQHNNKRVGILVFSHKGELTKLQENIMTSIAAILPEACMREEKEKIIAQLRHFSAFLPTLLAAADAQSMQRIAASYFIHSFNLTNCSIITENENYRYNTNRNIEPLLTAVENRVALHARQTKTPFAIKHPSNDVMTADIENIQAIKHSIAAFPLLYDRNCLGVMLAYYEQEPDTDILAALADQLALSLHIINRYSTAADKAQTDPLTGLPNRTALVQALSTYLPDAKNNKPTSLAVLDIDDFKIYNDTYGHLAGDKLLQNLAALMTNTIQHKNVYRFGGEEFIIFFPNTTQETANTACNKILEECRQKLQITASIGIVTCQNSTLGAYELISQADKALYRAKNTGKNKTAHFLVVDKNLGVIDIDEASSMGRV